MYLSENLYFDNAATTPLDTSVLEEMLPYFNAQFGNASSIHSFGRAARSAVERARKKVADILQCSPSEIFFTSCATEADNLAIKSAVRSLGLKNVISTQIEHHAVLHSIDELVNNNEVAAHYLTLNEKGEFDFDELNQLLNAHPQALVSLMHANNEIGNVYDIVKIGNICNEHNAIFHSDTVQTMGHFEFNLAKMPINFVVGSAHKFHGPKGIGFIYVKGGTKIKPYITGGAQERNMRAGTENVAGIVGLAKALEISNQNREANQQHIKSLKTKCLHHLVNNFKDIKFNGLSGDIDKSLHHIINIGLPLNEMSEMLLMNFDIEKIAISGGSACTSGAVQMSHVLQAISVDENTTALRISFSKMNTLHEVEKLLSVIDKLIQK